jgi:hypothetical protein
MVKKDKNPGLCTVYLEGSMKQAKDNLEQKQGEG